MRRSAWMLVAACAGGCGPGAGPGPAPSPPTPSPTTPVVDVALLGGTLLDGTGAPPLADSAVLVRGGRVAAVGTRRAVAVPDSVRIVELRGRFVLPGVINAHVHNAITLNALARWAASGVTTVRDVGAREDPAFVFDLRTRARNDLRVARLLAAGPIVTVPGGYPIAGFGFPSLAVTSPEDARMQVGRLADLGADVIKVALDPGPGWPVLSDEELRAVVETAHARGLPATAHVTESAWLERAVAAGIDDAAHGVRDAIPGDLARRMAQAGVVIVPTLIALGGGGANLRPFLDRGGRIALGNDGGYLEGIESVMPVAEMQRMRQSGMRPMEVIVAATRDAARVCRREHEIGTLESGKLADLIVVDADPLADLETLRQPRLVLREGFVLRDEL